MGCGWPVYLGFGTHIRFQENSGKTKAFNPSTKICIIELLQFTTNRTTMLPCPLAGYVARDDVSYYNSDSADEGGRGRMICPFDSSRVGWLGQSFSFMVVIYLSTRTRWVNMHDLQC